MIDLIEKLTSYTKHEIYISVMIACIESDDWVYVYQIKYLPKECWNLKRRATSFKTIESYWDTGSCYYGGYDSYEEAFKKAFEAADLLITKMSK